MKSGKLFWGLLFVTIGVLIFAAKFNWFYFDWDLAWDLWPVVLILGGIMIIARKSSAKPFLAALFGIIVGMIIYGSFATITNFRFWDNDWHRDRDWRRETSNYYIDYDSDIEKANLDLSAGAGKITIRGTTDELLSGYSYGDRVRYDFSSRVSNDEAYIDFDMRDKRFRIFQDEIDNSLMLSLNENPIWDMDFSIGAAKAIFELDEYRIEDLTLKTGATDIELRLGDKFDRTSVSVEMGAASLDIKIPKESGCQIRGKLFLGGKEFNDFKKVNNVYETENFDEAANKIYLEIHGAVASVEVKKY